MSQLDLLEYGARITDPVTSHIASYDRPARTTDRQRALDALRAKHLGVTRVTEVA